MQDQNNAKQLDLESFLREQDLLWDRLPTHWEAAPFVGNGLSGILLVFDPEAGRVRWLLGRTDVGKLDFPGKAQDPIRARIGSLEQVFAPGTLFTGGSIRMDLWNAEIQGALQTNRGDLQFRIFAPSGSASIVAEFKKTGDGLSWTWESGILPPGTLTHCPDRSVFFAEDFVSHPRTESASGGFSVVWGEQEAGPDSRRMVCSIGSTPVNRRLWNPADSGIGAREEAELDFERFASADHERARGAHRDWWHSFYRRGFFSLSDRELESFYWIQLYKFASTTRPDRPMIDNHGIWSVEDGYGFSTWDFNVQSTYRVYLAGNFIPFGRPLLHFLDQSFNRETMWDPDAGEFRAGMRQQCFLRYRFFDRKTWEHPDMPCDGPGKFLWGVHNYVTHYRHSLDRDLLPRMRLMLDAGINALLAGMELERDGLYHIPYGASWEAWKGRDPVGILAVMNWALETAIEFAEAAGDESENVARWKGIRGRIAPYPRDENGYLLGEGKAPVRHRHWTQMMMLFPLDISDCGNAEEAETLRSSIRFWSSLSIGPGGRNLQSTFSAVAAISLLAFLHAETGVEDTSTIAELADAVLHGRAQRSGPCIWPNTMYREPPAPVIETPIFMASALQECFLQSRRSGIHVFPAVPAAWPDATFSDWHAEGNFLLGAKRRAGRTEWIVIKSLSGGVTELHCDLDLSSAFWDGAPHDGDKSPHRLRRPHCAQLRMAAGDVLVLSVDPRPDLSVQPAGDRFGPKNSFGLNERFLARRPGFETIAQEYRRKLVEWQAPARSVQYGPSRQC